jgi:hypothetical protein
MFDVKNLRPSLCIECGQPHNNDGAQVGFLFGLPGMTTERMHQAIVPGLYRCNRCSELFHSGRLESNVDLAEAVEYLLEVYLPQVSALLEVAGSALPAAARAGLEAKRDQGVDAAATILAWMALGGTMTEGETARGAYGPDGQVVFEDSQPHEHGQDGEDWRLRLLDSVEMDSYGNMTYECQAHTPPQRHSVETLFESAYLFDGIRSDSKD